MFDFIERYVNKDQPIKNWNTFFPFKREIQDFGPSLSYSPSRELCTTTDDDDDDDDDVDDDDNDDHHDHHYHDDDDDDDDC